MSTPLTMDSVGKLIDGVAGGLPAMFAEDSPLARDCLRRVFGPELGMDVLETDGVADMLPMALKHDSKLVREMLLALLSGIAAAQPARLRAMLVGSGSLPLVTRAISDESVSVSEETQRLIFLLARGDEPDAADFLSSILGDGGLDALMESASGLLRIRLASLLIKLGTSPAVCDGFRVCIESGRLDSVLGLASLAGGGEVDLLELLSAYEMLSELGSCGAGWGYLASTGALDRLLALSAAGPESIESMLQPGALQFFATTIEAVRTAADSSKTELA
eukprot:COSAG02_NODE_6804_length_3351_cov_7.268696_2_plen_277_part_00